MSVSVGSIVEGVVTGITKFGAFVELPDGESGLVHISEISNDYVENVSDYLKKDQRVKVKVLSVDKDGKISLSIKEAEPTSTNPPEVDFNSRSDQDGLSFEDKLNKFLKVSNEKIDQKRSRDNRKNRSRRENYNYE